MDALYVDAQATVNFELGALAGPNDAVRVLNLNGLNINGGIVNVTDMGGLQDGTYQLIDYHGTLQGDFGDLSLGTPTVGGRYLCLVHNVANTSIDLVVSSVGPPAWNVDRDGNWSDLANWRGGVPSTTGAAATFGDKITGPRWIAVDTGMTVGRIDFDNANRYNLAGVSTLRLKTISGPATINLLRGSHTIAAPLSIASDAEIAAGTNTLNLEGRQMLGKGVTLTLRSGTVNYVITSGVSTSAAGARLVIDPGATVNARGWVNPFGSGNSFTDVLNNSATGLSIQAGVKAVAALDGSGNTAVADGAELAADRIRQNQLSIGAAARATVRQTAIANTAANTSVLGALVIAGGTRPTGRLDLNNNSLIIHYNGPLDTTLSDVTAQIRSGRNGVDANDQANWNGPGIITSAGRAANVVARFDYYNLGAINNADLDTMGIGRSFTAFAGQAVTPNSVLVKYTYGGDANLDGVVNGDDYTYWLNGFLNLTDPAIQGWLRGDFNYDGRADGDDYTQWLNTFLLGGPPLGGADGPAPVPEPGTLALAVLAGLGLLGVKRRKDS
jgi:hypothetical protein